MIRPAWASATALVGSTFTTASYCVSAPARSPVASSLGASSMRVWVSFGFLAIASSRRLISCALVGATLDCFDAWLSPVAVWPGRRAPSAAASATPAPTANTTTPPMTSARRFHDDGAALGRASMPSRSVRMTAAARAV